MPYQWHNTPEGEELRLWPHRSLPITGFAVFIAITSAMIAIPLLAVLGTPVLWGLLPFLVITVSGLWWALKRSYRDGQLLEVARLTPATIAVERHNPDGSLQSWSGQTYWVRVCLHHEGRPVEDYLVLRGGDRPIELGRFLSPEERRQLSLDLTERIEALRNTPMG